MYKWLQDTPVETLTDIQRAARFFYLHATRRTTAQRATAWTSASSSTPAWPSWPERSKVR
jgi:DNA adenine methylase